MATIKRKGLGRGLDALLPSRTSASGAAGKSLLDLPIDQIVPNKYQPRTSFQPEQLRELAQSIQSNGLVQPIIVRKNGNQYQLIAGERRWRAAQMAGLKTVPAVVKEVSEYKTLELALIENIQRQDLNPIEEATAYSSLIDDFNLTQEEVAQRVGKDRSSVANYLRLLKLPSEVKEMIQRNELTMGHARAISGLDRVKQQIELARRIRQEQLNVRQTENLIRSFRATGGKGKAASKEKAGQTGKDPNVKAAEQRLQEYFGTKVIIHQTSGESGKIEIHFRDAEDLIRVYDLIVASED